MKREYMWLLLIPFIAACSSHNNSVAFNPKKDRIVDASHEDRPNWLEQSNLGFIKGDMIYRIGVAETPANSSARKVTEVAAMKARADLAQELRAKLENRAQYASEGLSIDQSSLERIITEGSKIDNINALRTHEQYWEKIATSDGYSESTKYVGYSLVGMPLKQYRRQLQAAIRGNLNKSLSKKFQDKVDRNYEEFFNSPAVADSEKDQNN